MRKINIVGLFTIWTICLLHIPTSSSQTAYDMRCTYGERGSLTAYCTNVTSDFFKKTSYRFDHLDETLICVTCALDTIEAESFDIGGNKIKVLVLSNAGIQTIESRAFIGLIFLDTLVLSNNKISSITPGAFGGIRKLKKLEMVNALTSNLEDNVFLELHQLETLKLSKNNLTELKDNVFNGLNSLTSLDLTDNKIKELGDSLQFLTSLKSLYLSNNEIKEIRGNEFYPLSELLELYMANNFIVYFNLHMPTNSRLIELDLSNNNLGNKAVAVGTFKDLWRLEKLNLGLNWFESIPTKFFQGLLSLRSLLLYNNQIKKFETGSFSGLPNLRLLNLSHNNIATVEVTGRLSLHELHILDLSYNDEITNFDYVSFIQRAPRISSVNLVKTSLPCYIGKEIEAYFVHDNINFNLDNYTKSCTHDGVTVPPQKDLLQRLDEQLKSVAGRDSTPQTVMFVLLAIIVVCVIILLYVHFAIIQKLLRNRQ